MTTAIILLRLDVINETKAHNFSSGTSVTNEWAVILLENIVDGTKIVGWNI